MAEIRKITCDMCGRDIQEGYVLKPASRRRITRGSATNGAYRFDLCDACFNALKEACTKRRTAEETKETKAPGGSAQ